MTSKGNYLSINFIFSAIFPKKGVQIIYKDCINEGDIGGYPIPQYRRKKWQIPKYRVENRLNTDTA